MTSDILGSPDAALLDRYLADACTEAERVVVDRWLAADATRGAALHALVDTLRGDTPSVVRTEHTWERLVSGMAPVAPVARERSVRKPSRLGRQSLPLGTGSLFESIAAVATLIIIAIGVVVSRSGDVGRVHASPHVRTYTTASGQRADVVLADGSRAQLGPLTTLSVTTGSVAGQISARVDGMAFFTIAHRSHASFQVHVANTITRVLGTKFIVRRYSTDPVTRVVVIDGRVAVRGMHGQTLVTRNRVLTAKIAMEEHTAWTRGQLVFRKTPARDAVTELSRVYGVDIRIADSALATQTLNWTVPVAERSLAGILETLSDLLDARAVRVGRVITLHPGRSRSDRPVLPRSPSTAESGYGR
jgi:transmembrane sensor